MLIFISVNFATFDSLFAVVSFSYSKFIFTLIPLYLYSRNSHSAYCRNVLLVLSRFLTRALVRFRILIMHKKNLFPTLHIMRISTVDGICLYITHAIIAEKDL